MAAQYYIFFLAFLMNKFLLTFCVCANIEFSLEIIEFRKIFPFQRFSNHLICHREHLIIPSFMDIKFIYLLYIMYWCIMLLLQIKLLFNSDLKNGVQGEFKMGVHCTIAEKKKSRIHYLLDILLAGYYLGFNSDQLIFIPVINTLYTPICIKRMH